MTETYAGLSFTHDVEGASRFPGGLSFTHSVSGNTAVKLRADIGLTPAYEEIINLQEHLEASLIITPELFTKTKCKIHSTITFGLTPTLTVRMNVGYTDIIQFGSLVLQKARRIDWNEITLSCRSANIYDGSEALEVDPILGYYEKFRWFPTSDEEIKTLKSMIGKPYTLRVWGTPYRNVMLWGKLRIRQPRRGVSLWIVEGEFKQDTCRTGITA